jgi:hypothetical protein
VNLIATALLGGGLGACRFDPSGLPLDDASEVGVDASFNRTDADPSELPDATLPATPPDASACPLGWSVLSNRCYFFVEVELDWNGAQAACEALGASLASIGGEGEDNFVRSLVKEGSFWLGGSDGMTEGQWLWSDGTPWSYDHWGSGQPDNWFNEDCLERKDGRWNDTGCEDKLSSVCERPL